MAERQLPKLHTRVRFPSPAPKDLVLNEFTGLKDRNGRDVYDEKSRRVRLYD